MKKMQMKPAGWIALGVAVLVATGVLFSRNGNSRADDKKEATVRPALTVSTTTPQDSNASA